jgi:hypothetical protein
VPFFLSRGERAHWHNLFPRPGSDDGLTWAQSNGYKLINGRLGYIYKEVSG